MEYMAARRVSLKGHPQYSERWLQARIQNDPSILGLKGDLWVQAERREPYGGRLDLLLVDEIDHRRHEVEVQLGPTDPSHIIRTIEYWDHERSRHPSWEHVAVLVAEDVTSRFLNVIRLFNAAIPIMAIQINALQVGDMFTIDATTVLDLTMVLAEEDEDEARSEPTTRQDWEARASAQSMAVVGAIYRIVKSTLGNESLELSYRKNFIGMSQNGRVNNFVAFNPRKGDHALVTFRTPLTDELEARLAEAGLDLALGYRRDRTRARFTQGDIIKNEPLVRELIRQSADLPSEETDRETENDGAAESQPNTG